MNDTTERIVAGSLLILSGLIFAPGGFLYAGREIWNWSSAKSSGYLCWERGLVIAAVLVLLLGLVILERMLEAAGSTILAPFSMVIFLFGAVLVVVAETLNLSNREWFYAPVVIFVVLAFLSQAGFGVALLQTGYLPPWVGWATIIWNLVWLIFLPINRPHNIYYPWLHYTAPLLIGIGLLLKG